MVDSWGGLQVGGQVEEAAADELPHRRGEQLCVVLLQAFSNTCDCSVIHVHSLHITCTDCMTHTTCTQPVCYYNTCTHAVHYMYRLFDTDTGGELQVGGQVEKVASDELPDRCGEQLYAVVLQAFKNTCNCFIIRVHRLHITCCGFRTHAQAVCNTDCRIYVGCVIRD